MKQEIELIVVHATATIEGKEYDENWLRRVHQGPKDLSSGKVRWMGKVYKSRSELPNIDFHGVNLRKVKGNGWKQVGYYAMIGLHGTVIYLVKNNLDKYVDANEITNGAKGFNKKAIHVVYVGGLDENLKPKDTRTQLQQQSLVNLLFHLREIAPHAKILGHRDLPGVKKACPCFNAELEYSFI